MAANQDDQRPHDDLPLDDAAREIDDTVADRPDDGALPDHLDLAVETPVEDAIESLQDAGDFDDDVEPHG
jgi:hypothetical protein